MPPQTLSARTRSARQRWTRRAGKHRPETRYRSLGHRHHHWSPNTRLRFFFALLGRAKIIRVSGGSFQDMAVSTVRTWKMLKPKFAKERNAMNAFLDACAKPDIDSYHMTLLSYLKREDITFPSLNGKQKRAAQKDFIRGNQWASKTVARDYLDKGGNNFLLFDNRRGCANW